MSLATFKHDFLPLHKRHYYYNIIVVECKRAYKKQNLVVFSQSYLFLITGFFSFKEKEDGENKGERCLVLLQCSSLLHISIPGYFIVCCNYSGLETGCPDLGISEVFKLLCVFPQELPLEEKSFASYPEDEASSFKRWSIGRLNIL